MPMIICFCEVHVKDFASGIIELEKGLNIKPLPAFDPLPQILKGPVLIEIPERKRHDGNR
jgi:hypothetical protein